MSKILFYIAYYFACLMSLLPLGLLLKLSRLFHLVNWRMFGYRKSTIIYNLARSFPDKRYREIDKLADQYSRHLCRTMIEWLKLLTESERSLRGRITVSGREFLNTDPQRDLILVMGHYGNWEMLNMLPMLDERPIYAIYKRQASEVSNLFTDRMRSRFGLRLLEMKDSARFILTNKEPSIYVLLADQSPWIYSKRSLTFMHQTTLVFEGVERLARPKRANVVYTEIRPCDDSGCKRHHHITFTPLDAQGKRDITAQFFEQLEQTINAHPQYWLWSHRRWKHAPQVEQKKVEAE